MLTSVVIVAAFLVSLSWAGFAGAQEPDAPTLYLESAAGEAGSEIATSLLLRMTATGEVNAIELLLTFDDSVLEFDRLETSPTFSSGTGRPGQPGEVILLLASEQGCRTGATCHVGTLYWQALTEGDTEISLQSVTVLDGTEAIPGVVALDALLSINPGSGVTEPPVGELQPPEDATLGMGNAAVLGGLVLLLGLAAVVPFAVVGLRRRRATRQPVTGAFDHSEVYQFAARYLDDIQAAGSVDESHPDVEALARAHSTEI